MKLKNCTFIFDTEKDFHDFWDNHLMKLEDSEIIENTFLITRHKWPLRVLTWLLN